MNKKFSSHLEMAQSYWQRKIFKNARVIDATCGNGYDSLFLAKLLFLKKGLLYCFDVQKQAIENTKALLKESLSNVHFFNKSHEDFSVFIKEPVDLIIYNLGYLPKGNKALTTKVETTLQSIQSGLCLLAKKGALSIMCYPGHSEGKKELNAILDFVVSLPIQDYLVCQHKWFNKFLAPSLIWIEKLK